VKLNKVWRKSLRMWRWIAAQKIAGSRKGVRRLKREWLEANGYRDPDTRPMADCFFCEYDTVCRGSGCDQCPGRLVDSSFCCENEDGYDWEDNPIGFYARLLHLDEIRRRSSD
jgi:hypothetical protein